MSRLPWIFPGASTAPGNIQGYLDRYGYAPYANFLAYMQRRLCKKQSHVTVTWLVMVKRLNTLRPRQHGRHFPDDIFRCILLNENIWFAINISLSFVPKGPIDNIPVLVQIMAWCRSGDKPLSEPMMVSLLTHVCVTRPQWVKGHWNDI